MAIDERQRSRLYERLASAVGEEAATTMFELLPPPHSDVATTTDIDRLDQRFEAIDRRFEAIDRRFEAIDQRFEAIDQRFEAIDQRFAGIDVRFDSLQRELEGRIDAAKNEVLAAFRGELVGAVAGQTKALVAAIATTTVGIGGLAVVFSQLF
jgi:uncharacterized protein (DUF3084 family)